MKAPIMRVFSVGLMMDDEIVFLDCDVGIHCRRLWREYHMQAGMACD